MKKFLLIILLSLSYLGAENFTLKSPDKKLNISLNIDYAVQYSVKLNDEIILQNSKIGMQLQNINLGENPEIIETNRKSIDNLITPVVQQKSAKIRDNYNQLKIDFAKNWALIFRAYNDGLAYRITTNLPDNIIVDHETIEYNFANDNKIYFPEEESMFTHQEREYKHINISEIGERFSSIPALVDFADGKKVFISEADLYDYPGFYLTGDKENSTGIKAIFPHYPLKTKQTSDRDVPVTEYADHIARTEGTRNFPWRLMIITEEDKELVSSQMVYKLARPLEIKNTDWINPGKVAWDWWNALNIYGVDFKAGINTRTYKYYIDFAAKYNLDYIILDEGWSDTEDLFDIKPEIDLQELIDYGQEKEVGIILWMVWKALDERMDEAMKKFEEWGIKGIKVDFMQRDDQEMVNYYWEVARKAAKHHLLVDFHGNYKPAGLRRAYPNVITREGVRGLEQSKWSEKANPEMAVILPFTRMIAGPMDYTPGAMINATKENFRSVFTRPMSQGTRCHQLAMYVVYESPLQMLADSPSNYYQEPECMEFLSRVPTTWDKTKVLDGEVGEYIFIARRKNNEWYIGAMTDWNARDLELNLDFLEPGKYNIEIYKDGPNAHRNALDFARENRQIESGQTINIHLAPGGGWVGRIY